MKPGLPTSVGLHVTLLAAAMFSWSRGHDEPLPVSDPIEVTIGDTTQVRLGEKTAEQKDEIVAKSKQAAAQEREGKRAGASKQEEPPPPPPQMKPQPPQQVASIDKSEPVVEPPRVKPEPKPEPPKPVAKPEPAKEEPKKAAEKAPEVAKEPPPPPKPPEKKDPPKEPPKDTASLDKLLADKAKEPPKAAAPKAEAKPQPKADPVKVATIAPAKPGVGTDKPSSSQSSFNSKEISDILNKQQTGTAQGKTSQQASLGSPNGVNANIKMTASEIDAFVGQVRKCWNPPPGSSDIKGMSATLRIELQQDGTIAVRPSVIGGSSHPMGVSFAQSAVRAIMQCGPYRLPPEKYATWRDFDAVFTPGMI